jgi:hypothetical protein
MRPVETVAENIVLLHANSGSEAGERRRKKGRSHHVTVSHQRHRDT